MKFTQEEIDRYKRDVKQEHKEVMEERQKLRKAMLIYLGSLISILATIAMIVETT